jgi:hypothetical protein
MACPLYQRALKAVKSVRVSEHYSGEAPAPFVGRIGYPRVQVGMLSVPDKKNTGAYDNPRLWNRLNFSIPDLIEIRSSMVNARRPANVKESSPHLSQMQEIAMARKPVDVEVTLRKRPAPLATFNHTAAPYGPRGAMIKSSTGNSNIHTKVDKVFSDIDRGTASSVQYLYKAGFGEHFLSKILSVGVLGVKKDRKLVPTRWSITATDDMLSKQIIEKIKEYPMHECVLFEGDFMGNYYYFILTPLPFSYELFELYQPAFVKGKEQYSTDYESHFGRKGYATGCTGGYYSVRLAAVEYLQRVRRQASVFTLRIITSEYTTPLGVWVTREASRKAFSAPPLKFSTSNLALTYVSAKVRKKFGFSIESIFKKSKMLQAKQQTSLAKWT